jgi:hypothetical protein
LWDEPFNLCQSFACNLYYIISKLCSWIESKKLAEEGDDDMEGFEADTEEEEEEEADMGDAEDGDEADSLRLQKLAAEVSLSFIEFLLTRSMLL